MLHLERIQYTVTKAVPKFSGVIVVVVTLIALIITA